MRRLRLLMLIGQFLLVVATTPLFAAENVVVSRHSAVVIGEELSIAYRWVAANPASSLEVSTGGAVRSFTIPAEANRRTQNGFEGASTVLVPVSPSVSEAALSYALVLSDTEGNRSAGVEGKVALRPAGASSRALAREDETPPSLGEVQVNRLGGNALSFSSTATDEKGLHEVRFQVFVRQGGLVKQQVLSTLGKYWRGTTEAFVLPSGVYMVKARAVDSSGNLSPERTTPFSLYDVPQTRWPVSVKFNPPDMLSGQPKWKLDSGGWQLPSATLQVTPGVHRLSFLDLPGWRTPAPQSLDVKPGGVTASATYYRITEKEGTESRGLEGGSDGVPYRLVRLPATDAALAEGTRALSKEGGYYLKVTSQGGLGDVDQAALEVAKRVGGEVVNPGALETTRSAFDDSSLRREASIEVQQGGESRFPIMAAIDLFCYGSSLFKLNLCKDSTDVAGKVAISLGGAVTKVYDGYGRVFGPPPNPAQGTPESLDSQGGSRSVGALGIAGGAAIVAAGVSTDSRALTAKLTQGKSYGLIIGINGYQQIPKLKNAVNDAKVIDQVLKDDYGFENVVLLDQDATRDNIMKSLNDMRKKLTENDSLVIFYSGHGEFNKETETSYWLPVDAGTDDNTKWLETQTISNQLKLISAKHVLIIADSCFSGTMTRAADLNLASNSTRENYLNKLFDKPSRVLIASGGNEPVTDAGGQGHSIFSDVLIRALKEPFASVFTAEELLTRHLKESVAGRTAQTPEYKVVRNSGHDGGDFIFVKKK